MSARLAAMDAEHAQKTAFGRQPLSQQETRPSYSFGTGTRDALTKKSYISKPAMKVQGSLKNSPGPVYAKPSTLEQQCIKFGTEEKLRPYKAQYPDSSNDFSGATPDNQAFKYRSSASMSIGMEVRMKLDGDVVRNNPSLALCTETESHYERTPQETLTTRKAPEITFGPPGGPDGGKKVPPISGMRGMVNVSAVPRSTGPGSHRLPAGLGMQAQSTRRSAPSHAFSTSPRGMESLSARTGRLLLQPSPDLSTLGRQVPSSTIPSSPKFAFEMAHRDDISKTRVLVTNLDRGPASVLPKMRIPLNVPGPPTKC